MKKFKKYFSIILAVVMVLGTTTIASAAQIDDTFTMEQSHRGADRTYSVSKLFIRAQITDTSGNAISGGVVTIALNDYYGNCTLWNVPTDGNMYGKTFYIVTGRTYYITYGRTGTSKTLKLRIMIN